MKYLPNLLTLSILASGLSAQSTLDQLLASVEGRNKTILAEQHRSAAAKALLRTGLTVPDPTINFDWMQGFPETAGTQSDLTVAQAFDFPAAYKARKEISRLLTAQTLYESELVRKDILLETKLIALRLIYLNKYKAELTRRMQHVERFYSGYQTKLEQQDATILDVNKARLQLVNIRTDLQLLEAEATDLLHALTGLNGGEPVSFTDTVYPPVPEIPDFETLERAIEARDPGLAYLLMQQDIGEAELQYTRAMLLPKFEVGYRYQGLLGQRFHGIHTAVAVPLWENKRQRGAAEEQLLLHAVRTEEHRIQHYHEIRRQYDQYQTLHRHYDEYLTSLQSLTGAVFLERALDAGQITVLEYFVETTVYYESIDRHLALEEFWHRTLAMLLKYEL